jgi:dihydrofolate reductase/thymidylate synthase
MALPQDAGPRDQRGAAMPVQVVMACVRMPGQRLGIGHAGRLPWRHLDADVARFRSLSLDAPVPNGAEGGGVSAVVMGRRTWESLPPGVRPLSGRLNIVLSGSGGPVPDAAPAAPVVVVASPCLGALLDGLARWPVPPRMVTIMGGADLFAQALAAPDRCGAVHVTYVEPEAEAEAKVEAEVEAKRPSCDTWIADTLSGAASPWTVWSSSVPRRCPGVDRYNFVTYVPAAGRGGGGEADATAWPIAHEHAHAPATPLWAQPRRLSDAVWTTRHAEHQYLDLVRAVLQDGEVRPDRTGTGTVSLFGAPPMRFDLREGAFPLLTTKRVFWRGVVEELLWFLRGSTDARELAARGVHIWDANTTRAALDAAGRPHLEEGCVGASYGHQWRHFGAPYVDGRTDYTGQGVDQVANVLHLLRTDPTSRRIVLSAWNPAAQADMALPPCHVLCQFYVSFAQGQGELQGDLQGELQGHLQGYLQGYLSCHLYQRSGDVGLGVPFNIASYALLTCLLAHACGMRRGTLVHTLGDAHVYANHVDALRAQLAIAPRPFPRLEIGFGPDTIELPAHLAQLQPEHFRLVGYRPHPALPMPMAV